MVGRVTSTVSAMCPYGDCSRMRAKEQRFVAAVDGDPLRL